ncbi:MAG: carbohydrate ABC transporter permease [Acidimicrobiia bacterium]
MSDITVERPAVAIPEVRKRKLPGRIISRITLVVLSTAFLFPFYWMLATSLKSPEEMRASPPTLWPYELVWQNYTDAVTAVPFWTFFRNTVIITIFTVIGSVISNPFIAYGFSQIKWPGRDKVFYIVLATVFVPFPVLIVALFDIFAKLGWINTFLPLVVPFFFGQAFWIFLMRQFFLQIPHEIADAARIDGASEVQTFFRVIMPLALPAVGVVGLFAALFAWNDFLGPLIYLQGVEKYTLAVGLTFFRSQHDVQFNLLMAASTFVMLPVVAMFFLFQRTLVEGITLGSIK